MCVSEVCRPTPTPVRVEAERPRIGRSSTRRVRIGLRVQLQKVLARWSYRSLGVQTALARILSAMPRAHFLEQYAAGSGPGARGKHYDRRWVVVYCSNSCVLLQQEASI